MIHQHSDSTGLWLFASGQPIRVVATRLLVMRTWATRKDRNPKHLTENLNWTPNLSKIRRIWEPWFYIYWGTTLWTVALKRPIFKRKKGFANLSLGLIYHSKTLPQPPSRDTVPLNALFHEPSFGSYHYPIELLTLAICGEITHTVLYSTLLTFHYNTF
jgi:hypothetical protein